MRASLERQLLLPEFAGDGQVRLARAPFIAPADEPEAVIALGRDYARRAGLSAELAPSERERAEALPFPHEGHFRHAASRDVGRGAHLALVSIHRALGAASTQPESSS